MAGFLSSQRIERPPEEVFAFMTNLENAPEFSPGITSIEKITEGPMGEGTRFRETRKRGNKEMSSEIEVVEYEPPLRFGARSAERGIEASYYYSFEPEHGGTQVDLVCEVKGKGFMKLMTPVVARFMKKADGGQLKRAKAILEGA